MIYAIADIHGCLTALQDLMAQLPLRPEDEVVFLGDYIDRGPDSKGVVDYLLAARQPKWHFLLGNHEQLFLEWFANPSPVAASNWIMNGGSQTLQSYVPKKKMDAAKGDELHALLLKHMTATHVSFFSSLALAYETPDYFFCHAGIDLDKPLNAQDPADLLWIRREFSQDPRPAPKTIIYGHTPVEKVVLKGDRINIDTGCVYGGVLTALALPDMKIYEASQ